MRTRAKLEPQLQPVTHGTGVVVRRRRDRAHARAAVATAETPSKVLAQVFGVSDSRARHLRTDDQSGPVTTFYALLADPRVDAAPLLVGALVSFEERFVTTPTADLRERLHHLKYEAEHLAEAAQNRALQTPTHQDVDAVVHHAAVLIEIAMLEGLLGAERPH